jgi:alkylation response protein AidB-like acyl-CoA dehydrogenase
MRGTGSDTWVADDLFVPGHRIVPMTAITEDPPQAPGRDPVSRLTFVPSATLALVGPLLGLGRAALDLVIEKARTKAIHDSFIARQSESVGVQIQVAEAALALSTARLHAYDIATTLDAAVAEGHAVTYLARTGFRARLGYAARQVIDAMSLLLDIHGAGSFAESNLMQQYWRDASTAARHASLRAAVGYELYGKSLLGVEDRISSAV